MPNFRKQRIAGRVIKGLFVLFVVAVNAIILWRVFFSANIPESLEALTVNEPLRTAYEQHGEELTLQYQNQKTTTYAKSNRGYFSVVEYVFIPEAEQVQVVFRYNNSTLRHLAADYGLAEIPDKAGEYFDVTLLHVTDLTPDTDADNNDPAALSSIRYKPTDVKRDTTSLYTYYRYVFDGIHVDEQAISHVFLDVYYLNDLNYEKDPYGTLLLYDQLHEWLPYDLTKADKKALGAK